MTVHVDTFDSEVVALPSSDQHEAGESAAWREVARLRDALARLAQVRRRTRAEGFDD